MASSAPNMDVVIKTMRGLLNISKNGLAERQLRREFRENEGYDIPYKSFGFNTLLDFLRSSNQFDLTSTNDGIQVRAKLMENSSHLVQMVRGQNCAKKKKNAKATPFVPRLQSANRNQRPHSKVNLLPYYLRLCIDIRNAIAMSFLCSLQPGFNAGRKPSNAPQQRKEFGNATNRNNVGYGQQQSMTNGYGNRNRNDENWNGDWNSVQPNRGNINNQANNSVNTNSNVAQWNRAQQQKSTSTLAAPANQPNQSVKDRLNAIANAQLWASYISKQTQQSAGSTPLVTSNGHCYDQASHSTAQLNTNSNNPQQTLNSVRPRVVNSSFNVTSQPVEKGNTLLSNQNASVERKMESKPTPTVGVASSWLTEETKITRKSVFDRITKERQNIQSRLIINEPSNAKPQIDTVDNVPMMIQNLRVAREIEPKMVNYFTTFSEKKFSF